MPLLPCRWWGWSPGRTWPAIGWGRRASRRCFWPRRDFAGLLRTRALHWSPPALLLQAGRPAQRPHRGLPLQAAPLAAPSSPQPFSLLCAGWGMLWAPQRARGSREWQQQADLRQPGLGVAFVCLSRIQVLSLLSLAHHSPTVPSKSLLRQEPPQAGPEPVCFSSLPSSKEGVLGLGVGRHPTCSFPAFLSVLRQTKRGWPGSMCSEH